MTFKAAIFAAEAATGDLTAVGTAGMVVGTLVAM